jgi:hypothetical protein
MSLTAAQQQILKTVLRVGKQVGASPKELKAAVETGLVESNFTNSAAMTDHDSQGWRQERASLYPNPTNVEASAKRFFQEARGMSKQYGSAGALAAAVQRPAAQYRGRYQERSGDAQQLLQQFANGLGASAPGTKATAPTSKTTTTSNAAEVNAANLDNQRRSIVLGLISKHNPNSLLVTSGALAPKAVPGLQTLSTTRTTSGTPGSTAKSPTVTPSTGGGKGASAALSWAKSTLGVSESGGANRGPRVDQWEARFGLSAQPWCAIFTSLAVTKGGAPKSARTPAVRDVRLMAQSGKGGYEKGFVPAKQAHAGDLILFGNDHIGMVESVGPSGITMIAGNDSNKVQRRTVAFGSGDIVRPKYAK